MKQQQQLIMLSAHKPTVVKKSPAKYKADYGLPEYGFYSHKNTERIIREAVEKEYTVFAYCSNGKVYVAKKYLLIDLDSRAVIDLLHSHLEWDEIIIDEILQTVRIYIK